jgi:branched-chain amino acid transport system ATP-binding protein
MNDSPPLLLQSEGLSASYGGARVLFDVALEVARGEVVALMGRNGAGKSTTFKALIGLMPQRSGNVRFQGKAISRLEVFEAARLGLGYVPEDRRIFTELTVMENLEVGRQPPRPGAPVWTAEKLFALFPNLGAMKDRMGGQMSGGEQQMLAVARTLMGNPYLVMLDEPSEGLAPTIVEEMASMILALKREGLSVLLSEQNLFFAQYVSDRAYVIDHGQIRYHGSMQELAADDGMRRAHLTV